MDENGGGLHGGAPAGQVTRLDAMIIGAGVAGLYQLHQLRALGSRRARLRQCRRRRRDVVLEQVSWCQVRLRELHLPVSVLRGALQGLELERALPRPAGDRALDELHRRPARPQEGHPARDDDHAGAVERGDRALAVSDRPRRDDRHAVPDHLLRHALSADRRPVPRPGQLQGPDLPHRPLAKRADRARRQARRRRRHGCHGHPGDPDHRGPGRPPQGVRPHAAIRAADEEPGLRRAGGRRLQGPVRRAEVDAPPHLHRVRVRFRAGMGRAHARSSGRRGWRTSSRRLAQALARLVRRDLLRRGDQRGDLRVRAREDARPAQGRAAVRSADPEGLRLRHPPRAARDQLSGSLSAAQRRGGERPRQPDRRA